MEKKHIGVLVAPLCDKVDMFDVLVKNFLDFVLAADDVDASGWQLDIYCGGYVSAIDDCTGG